MSIVRQNLMTREGYSPYCAEVRCFRRARFNPDRGQFGCPVHSFETSFEPEFIEEYRKKWGK